MEKRIIGGVILIVGAASVLWTAVGHFTGADWVGEWPIIGAMFEAILKVCGAIETIFGVMGLLGGVFAILGRNWTISIVGAVLTILGWGAYDLGAILGLVALIILALSRQEFAGEQKTVQQGAMAPQYAPPMYTYPPQQTPPPPQYMGQQYPPQQPPQQQYPPQQPPQQPPQGQ